MAACRAWTFTVVALLLAGSVTLPAGGDDQPRRRRPIARGTQQPCTDNAPRVIDDIYQQVLDRSADESSAPITQDLAGGRKTVRQTVAELAKSAEYKERFLWRPAVEQLYRRLLGRDADPEGLRVFTDKASREGLGSVARDIMQSDEYRRRGSNATALRDDGTDFEPAVRSLYIHILARDPDEAGLRSLSDLASQQGFDAAIDRMINSEEYMRQYGEDGVPGRGARFCRSQL